MPYLTWRQILGKWTLAVAEAAGDVASHRRVRRQGDNRPGRDPKRVASSTRNAWAKVITAR